MVSEAGIIAGLAIYLIYELMLASCSARQSARTGSGISGSRCTIAALS